MSEPIGHRGVGLPGTRLRLYWNALPEGARYFGRMSLWYDGLIYCFGFWYWHVYLMH